MQNAEVLTKFTADTKDFDSKAKGTENKAKSIANGISSAFEIATVAVTAATTAVGALVTKSVQAYSEFEQLEGGLVSLFGNGSNEMNAILKKSEEAYKNLTMSQNDYLNAFQSAYPLVNAGLSDNADSIEYTNKMLQISSDLFNTYGGSVEQYQNAINWALKGSFVYLDNLNLGIKGTQEGFIEAANASGVLEKSISNVNELTSDEIIDVISHYADEYGVLGKTAAEASDTILGSLNMTKASWSNFILGLSKDGADIDKLIDDLINSAMAFGNNMLPVIEKALSGIVKALPTVINKIVETLPGLLQNILPPLIQGAIEIINGLVLALPQIMPILAQGLVQAISGIAQILPTLVEAFVQGLIALMQALAEQAPVIVPVVVQAIIDGLLTLLEHIDLLIDAGIQLIGGLIVGLIQSIPQLIASIPKIVGALISGFANLLGIHSPSTVFADFGVNILKGLINGLFSFVGNVVSTIANIGGKIISSAANALNPSNFLNIGKNIIGGLVNGVKNMASNAINAVKNVGSSILGGIKGVLGIHSPSTETAILAKFTVLGFTEQLDKMKKTIQSQVADTFELSPQLTNSASLHYSPSVQVVNNVNVKQDSLGQFVNDIKTFSGGSKNDYNYGAGV